jgi:hypothetical protein
MSLNDFDALGIHEYQRVQLRLPGRDEAPLYLRGCRESPPFAWLEFGTDVRRQGAAWRGPVARRVMGAGAVSGAAGGFPGGGFSYLAPTNSG